MADMTPRLMNVEDAARYAGLSRSELYRLMKDDRVASVKVGGRRRFLREDLDALVDRMVAGAKSA